MPLHETPGINPSRGSPVSNEHVGGPEEARRPTIREVARLASLHFTTVSKALHDDPRIAEATRARVKRIAAKVGYVRDPVAMALTRFRQDNGPRRGPNLAFITNHPSYESFARHVHMRQFLAGATAQAQRYGYGLELMFVGESPLSAGELARRMEELACEGGILGALQSYWPQPDLERRTFPVVRIDSRYLAPKVPLVTNDQIQIVRLAAARARALGYRRVAFMVGDYDEASTGNLFSSAWLADQEDVAPEARVPMLRYEFGTTGAELRLRIADWISRHRVDALLVNLDEPDWLWEGFPESARPAFASLGLSSADGRAAGVVQNYRLVGEVAVDALIGELRGAGRRSLPVETLVPGDWHAGASLPPVS